MGALLMSEKERRRMGVLSRVKARLMTLKSAADLLRLGYRQTKRVWKRYREQGDAGLVHQGRGRASNRRLDSTVRRNAIALCRTRYAGFGPTLAAEHLAEDDHVVVDHETLRRWMLKDGLWEPRKSRAKHRAWRERRGKLGEMVQMDGSEHDWFEGRGARAVLMVMIDDATNRTYARFYPAEDTAAAFDVFGRYARREGMPQSLYVDRDSIYRTERQARIDEELRDEGALTQFKRAMKQLGVELILANSPQAKGRVERRHGVFQDRLIKEMRLRSIQTIRQANDYLDDAFLKELNRKFTVPARERQNLHRPVPLGLRLDEVLCWEDERVVQNDWTVRWQNRWFQVQARHAGLALAGKRVTVRRLLDNTVQLVWRGQKLRYRALPDRPAAQVVPVRIPEARVSRPPPPGHPWQRAIRAEIGQRRASKPAPVTPPPACLPV